MVYHNAKGEGYVSFVLDGGENSEEQFAEFRMRDLFVDGSLVMQKVYHSWPLGKRMDVNFNAVKLDAPFNRKEKVINVDDGTETVMNFVCLYQCIAVWAGEKPSADKLRATLKNVPRSFRLANLDQKERLKDCEYQCCTLHSLQDNQSGLLFAKRDRYITSNVEDLVINGVKVGPEEDLNDLLLPGEQIFAYIRKLAKPLSTNDKVMKKNRTLLATVICICF